jgi:hypothetical protein
MVENQNADEDVEEHDRAQHNEFFLRWGWRAENLNTGWKEKEKREDTLTIKIVMNIEYPIDIMQSLIVLIFKSNKA